MSVKQINSRENAQFKAFRNLATSASARHQSKQTLLDGIHLCEAYLRQIGMPCCCIVGESAGNHPEAVAILASCEAANAPCIALPDKLFGAISELRQGVQLMFVIEIPTVAPASPLDESAILLDHVQDPSNLGAILRTVAAAGILAVYCSPGCASAWSPKVMRAGMGAQFSLCIVENADLGELIMSSAITTIATSPHADQTLYALDLQQPVAWLFGHEGQGVTPELLKRATHLVSIPQATGVESLNVAASAAICLFEQRRQQFLRLQMTSTRLT